MAGSLLLRLVFFYASQPSSGLPFILDEGNYVGIAGPLSEGEGFVDKWAWLRPPGYPAFLAFFLIVWGSLPAAALAQILLSVANVGLIYALAMETLAFLPGVARGKAQAAGLLAAGLLALNPHVAFYANLFMPETLYMLALTGLTWALLRGIRLWRTAEGGTVSVSRTSLAMFALAGLIAAAAIYLRSLLLTFAPLMMAWLWWVLPREDKGQDGARSPFKRRGSWRSLLLIVAFLAAIFVAILPWTLRNYFEYDRFMLVDAVGGLNLWQYNDNIARDEIVQRLMEIPNPVDRDRYASEQGIRAILANPLQFASDAAARFADSWPVESFTELRVNLRNKHPGIDCLYLDVFAWAETAFYIALGLLAVWGFASAPGRTLKGLFLLLLLHYAATTMFAHAEFRYRMPLYPFASLYAGWAIANFGLRIAKWRFRRKASEQTPEDVTTQNPKFAIRNSQFAIVVSLIFLAQSALIAAPGVWKGARFERRYLEGRGKMERGDYRGALQSFMGAEAIDKGCACLYRNIGLAHSKLGQPDEERAAYAIALSREEHDWRTAALLSDRLRAAGNPRAASPIRATRPEYRLQQLAWAWDNLSPPPISQLDVGEADIGYLKGFEAGEIEPGPKGDISYRWTTSHAYIRLAPPLVPQSGEGRLRLVIRWHSLAWPGKPDPDATVRVLINGSEITTLTAHPGWEVATLDLPPQEGKPGPLVIELLTPTARPPSSETRLLGVAVDSIRLESTR